MNETRIEHWTKLGTAVREARRARSLSQAELGAQAGVSRSWLAKLESGHRGAEFEQILLVLSALGQTMTISEDATAATGEPTTAAARLKSRRRTAAAGRQSAWTGTLSKPREPGDG